MENNSNKEDRQLILNRLIAFQGKSKLKTAALNMLVKQMSEEKNKRARSIFTRMD